MVHIFLYSDWIQENTDQKKLHIWTLSTQCILRINAIADIIPKCDQDSDSWKQLEVASELEYHLQAIPFSYLIGTTLVKMNWFIFYLFTLFNVDLQNSSK